MMRSPAVSLKWWGSLKVGDGMQDDTTIGPLIDLEAANSVLSMVEEAVENGCAGRRRRQTRRQR